MLWVWLHNILFAVGRFLLPPPPHVWLKPVNPDAQCPACGNRDGFLKFGTIYVPGTNEPRSMVIHNCRVCSCSWGELPLSVPMYPVSESPVSSRLEDSEVAS